MKRAVRSSTYAQRVYYRTLHGEDKPSQTNLTHNMCYLVLDFITKNPYATFSEAYDHVVNYLVNDVMPAAKTRLQSQDVWTDDSETLEEAIG